MKKKFHLSKKARWLLLAAAVLLAAGGAWGYHILYDAYIQPRIDSSFATYAPFSGKAFDIDPSQVEELRLKVEKDDGRTAYWMSTDSPEDIRRFTEHLNSFRSFFWLPAPPERKRQIPGPPIGYIRGKAGQSGTFYFDYTDQRILVHPGDAFTEEDPAVSRDTYYYFFDAGFTQTMVELADQWPTRQDI